MPTRRLRPPHLHNEAAIESGSVQRSDHFGAMPGRNCGARPLHIGNGVLRFALWARELAWMTRVATLGSGVSNSRTSDQSRLSRGGWGPFFMRCFAECWHRRCARADGAARGKCVDPPADPRPAGARTVPAQSRNRGQELGALRLAESRGASCAGAPETARRQARRTIAELQSTRLCAEFPEMTVILHEPVVAASPFAPSAARAFSADINIGGQWVSAFVVNARLRG